MFYGPGLDCEQQPNFMISTSFKYNPHGNSSFEIRLNTSAMLDESPPTWISPGSPDFLEQETFPIYAAVEPHPGSSKFSKIWVQYLNNDSVSPIIEPSIFSFKPAQIDQVWRTLECTLLNTTYSLKVVFENGISTTSAKTISSTPLDITGALNFSTSPHYAYYLGAARALFSSLAGSIYVENYDSYMIRPFVINTQISLSNLVNLTTFAGQEGRPSQTDGTVNFTGTNLNFVWSVRRNFTAGMSKLLTDITLSLMATNVPTVNTTCQSTRTEIVYEYNPKFLLLTYGLGLFATLCSLAAGLYTLQDNGVAMDNTFSEIVAATRNPALDQALADEGYTMAARKSARYLEQKVMYGEIGKEHGDEYGDGSFGSVEGQKRAAFGLQGQVTRLRKRS